MTDAPYRGRFAPSPTGALHAGSLAAALASWLDARAHGGAWLIRIEDLDPPREVPGAARQIVDDLARLGMESDEPVVHQADRGDLYADALRRLQQAGLVYGCACSRKDSEDAAAAAGTPLAVYPGTCRNGTAGRPARALRLRVDGRIEFDDRAAGLFVQDLEREVGDFVLRRADGLWAYQLAVVVDDAAQGITDVVRGADLLDNTPRQIYLQRLLQSVAIAGEPAPTEIPPAKGRSGLGRDSAAARFLHVPVVTNAEGEKLSKQTGAQPLDMTDPLGELERAWQHLGFARLGADSVGAFQTRATELWRSRWCTLEPSHLAN
jgi:glutamyl-Q tRNA(Asp) synthetase